MTGAELPPARAAGRDLDYAVIDIDATLVTAHSQAGRGRHLHGRLGLSPDPGVLDNTNDALAAILRPGNAGSNTAADHVAVLDLALAQLPEQHRGKWVVDLARYQYATDHIRVH